jgi:non-specific serine/threonine protein kinase
MANTVNTERGTFGALLLHLRAAAGLTQEQLAERAGLSPNAIAALEHGRRRMPRAVTVDLLATALGLDAHARTQLLLAARGMLGTDARERSGPTPHTQPSLAPDLRRSARWPAGEPAPLVGRVHELHVITQLLGSGDTHLLTLTGPAGVGKTRLARAAAARLAEDHDCFPDGVVFVDLSAVREPALVLGSLAGAIGLLDMGSRSLLERLTEILAERRLLVVVDNFEQVLPAAASLGELLATCSGLALLVTSRAPLQLRWEQALRIAPLPVPDPTMPLPPLEELAAVPSVALFVQRARARQADFVLTEKLAPVVAQLAAELDGLPLALELAAARAATLPLPAIASRLGDRLRLLRWEAADVPDRQRSLEAAVGWSYDLLGEEEQRLFRCLGVFAGCISLDAIAAVVTTVADVSGKADGREWGGDGGRALDRLLSLAEQSLILPMWPADLGWQQGGQGGHAGQAGIEEAVDEADDAEGSEPIFGMLETVREYARERLAAAGELEVARRAHAHSFLALAKQSEPELHGHAQRSWFFRLEREHDNLRAALRWLLDQVDEDEGERALCLAGALGYFWRFRGYHAEGWRWLEEALGRGPTAVEGETADPVSAAVHTQALLEAGGLLAVRGEVARARTFFEEALALARRQEDLGGIVQALCWVGLCARYAGEAERAVAQHEEALRRARALGDPFHVVAALYYLGGTVQMQGNVPDAAAHYVEALDLLEAAGDARAAGALHFELGAITGQQGDLPGAARHVRAGLQTSARLRDRWLVSFGAQAVLAVVGEHADPVGQARLVGAADALRQATGAGRALWEHVGADRSVVELRATLPEAEWEATYREGQALPAGDVVTLALRLLDEVAIVAKPPSRPEAVPEVPPESATPSPQSPGNPLSAREQEVLRLVSEGFSSKDIGRQLVIAPSTVNQHVKAIFDKLGVDTRAQAVTVASQQGLLRP